MISKEFLRNSIYVCLTIIPFLAWYVADSMFFPFISGKNLAFRVLVEIMFVAWAVLAIKDVAYRVRGSLVIYAYGAFISVLAVANFLGVNPIQSFFSNFERMEGFISHLHLFLYFIVLYAFLKTERAWNYVLGIFVASSVPVLIEGYFQLLGSKAFWGLQNVSSGASLNLFQQIGNYFVEFLEKPFAVRFGDGLRIDSSLGNAAYYGIYTVFYTMLAFVLFTQTKKFKFTKNLNEIWNQVKPGLLNFFLLVIFSIITLLGIKYEYLNNFTLGTFLYFTGIIFVLYYAVQFAKKWEGKNISGFVFLLIAILSVIQLIFTQTRGSQIGFIIGIGVLVGAIVLYKIYNFLIKGFLKQKEYIAKGIISLLIIFAIVIGPIVSYKAFDFLASYKDTDFVKNNLTLNRLATIDLASPKEIIETIQDKSKTYLDVLKVSGEQTIASRFMNIGISLNGVKERPMFGFGQDNYTYVFSKYNDSRMYAQETWFDRSHNVFFDWLVAGGIFGLLTYLALYFTSIWMLWMAKGRTNMGITERSVLTGLLIAYFVHNIFVFDNLVSYILFFTLLAYIASRTRLTDKELEREDKVYKSSESKFGFVLSGGFGLLLLVGLYFNYSAWATNGYLLKLLMIRPADAASLENIYKYSKLAVNRNIIGKTEAREQVLQKYVELNNIDLSKFTQSEIEAFNKVKQNMFELAYAEGKKLVDQSNGENMRSNLLYAQFLSFADKKDEALVLLEKSYAFAPKKQTVSTQYVNMLLNLANEFSLTNKAKADEYYNKAYEVLEKSYIDDPTFTEVARLYGFLVGKTNNFDRANTVWNKIYGDVLGKVEVIIAYVQAKKYNEAIKILDKSIIKDPENKDQYEIFKKEVESIAKMK